MQQRGYYAINGDNELAYQGDPETGNPTNGLAHEHHIWHVDRVKALVASQNEAVTFFCGGSRNFSKFVDLFEGVFILEVDRDTLDRRLHERPEDEGGGKQTEQELIMRLHQTKETFRKTVSWSMPPLRSQAEWPVLMERELEGPFMPVGVVRLSRPRDASGDVVVRLGVPLLDQYLEFLAGRCRPNTVLAVAYDLKVFFTVAGKAPRRVRPVDVLAFTTAQRAGGQGRLQVAGT